MPLPTTRSMRLAASWSICGSLEGPAKDGSYSRRPARDGCQRYQEVARSEAQRPDPRALGVDVVLGDLFRVVLPQGEEFDLVAEELPARGAVRGDGDQVGGRGVAEEAVLEGDVTLDRRNPRRPVRRARRAGCRARTPVTEEDVGAVRERLGPERTGEPIRDRPGVHAHHRQIHAEPLLQPAPQLGGQFFRDSDLSR